MPCVIGNCFHFWRWLTRVLDAGRVRLVVLRGQQHGWSHLKAARAKFRRGGNPAQNSPQLAFGEKQRAVAAPASRVALPAQQTATADRLGPGKLWPGEFLI